MEKNHKYINICNLLEKTDYFKKKINPSLALLETFLKPHFIELKFYQLRFHVTKYSFEILLSRFNVLNGLCIIHSHLSVNSFTHFLSFLQRGWIHGL